MEEEVLEISLEQIVLVLWQKIWLIILCLIMGTGVGYGVSKYLIQPTYASRVSMYVNNNKERSETALNLNDINASQKLVSTYIEILNSETVLNQVIEKMALNYTIKEMRGLITANSINNTEILEITVKTKSPEEAAAIANALVEVGTPEIIRVVKAGDVQVLDHAVIKENPVAPNVTKWSLVCGALATVGSIMIILLLSMLDISVKSGEDLEKRFGIPVLGNIPDLVESMKKN